LSLTLASLVIGSAETALQAQLGAMYAPPRSGGLENIKKPKKNSQHSAEKLKKIELHLTRTSSLFDSFLCCFLVFDLLHLHG
jgi:hypothetical protein